MSETIFSGSNKLLCRSSDGGVGEHPLLCRRYAADDFPLLYSAGYSRIGPDYYAKGISGSFTGVSSFAAARTWLAANVENSLDAEPWGSASAYRGAQYSVAYYPSATRLTYAISILAMRFALPSSTQYATIGKIVAGDTTYINVGAYRSPPCLAYEFRDSPDPRATLAEVYALTHRITVVDGQNTYDGLRISVDFTKQYFWLYVFIDPYSPPDDDAPNETRSQYGRASGNGRIFCYA